MGGILLRNQQDWVADKSRVKVWEKSRRIGASWTEASDDVLQAAENDGQNVYYISYNKEMTQQFIFDCAEWVKTYALAASAVQEEIIEDEGKAIHCYRIDMASGRHIMALSGHARNIRSKQGIVVIDEAGLVDDLRSILKAAMALLMWGGKVRIISTHNGAENPFNELIQEVREGRKSYNLHRTTLDDSLADGLFKRICEKEGRVWSPEAESLWRAELIADYGDDAQEELFCVPSKSGGRYIPRAMIEACMSSDIPVIRWTCTDDFTFKPEPYRNAEADAFCEEQLGLLLAAMPNLPTFVGEDFGRSGTLTVIWPVQRQVDLSLRTPFIVELRNCPFETQKQIFFYLVTRLPRFYGATLDARGNGQYLAEVAAQRYGASRINQAMATKGWYLDNMPRMKAFFEDGRVTVPRHSDVLDDLRTIQMINGVPQIPDTISTGSDSGKRHGDAAFALCAAVNAANCENFGPASPPVSRMRRETAGMLSGYYEAWR